MNWPRLEAAISNITPQQPLFQRAEEVNFTSLGNFGAIIPGRALVRGNNWMERNTHLMRLWEQTQIPALETSAWLSFGWNVTGKRGWLWLIILIWKDWRQAVSADSFDSVAQVINDLLIQINSCLVFFFKLRVFVNTSQAWWECGGASIKGEENKRAWQGVRCFPAEARGKKSCQRSLLLFSLITFD